MKCVRVVDRARYGRGQVEERDEQDALGHVHFTLIVDQRVRRGRGRCAASRDRCRVVVGAFESSGLVDDEQIRGEQQSARNNTTKIEKNLF